jgi:hypothetical protein
VIPSQIPPDREHWPPGVLDELKKFRQGDVVPGLPYFYWGNPANGVLDLTSSYADDGQGIIESALQFDYGMIATQTCDIAEEDSPRPSQPWVHLCPVYNAEATYQPTGPPPDKLAKLIGGGDRKLIRQGRLQRYLWLPAIPDGLWIADLRLLLPVEKGWLATRDRIEPFHNEPEQLKVGRLLAWLHDRPAFDGRFVTTVQQPLAKALGALRRDDATLFERLYDQVAEIGVSTDRNIAIKTAEVVVLCNEALDGAAEEWLRDWWAESAQAAADEGLTLLPLRTARLDQMTAAEYRTFTRLPLAAVSPNPAWYGEDPYDPPDPDS